MVPFGPEGLLAFILLLTIPTPEDHAQVAVLRSIHPTHTLSKIKTP
jgi:hypothetical protein